MILELSLVPMGSERGVPRGPDSNKPGASREHFTKDQPSDHAKHAETEHAFKHIRIYQHLP